MSSSSTRKKNRTSAPAKNNAPAVSTTGTTEPTLFPFRKPETLVEGIVECSTGYVRAHPGSTLGNTTALRIITWINGQEQYRAALANFEQVCSMYIGVNANATYSNITPMMLVAFANDLRAEAGKTGGSRTANGQRTNVTQAKQPQKAMTANAGAGGEGGAIPATA